jgi:hypothetical protein
MRGRVFRIGPALAACLLWPAWAVKPGEPAPDITARDGRGAEVRLSTYRQKSHIALLAQAAGAAPAQAVWDDTCRRLAALDTVVLWLPGDGEPSRKLRDGAPAATFLIDRNGVVRRVLPGRLLTGPDLAGFVELWLTGKAVYNASCARCHGEDGDLNICLDVKPLAGIGRRLTEAQIRERLRPGEINDRELLIRGQTYRRQDVDAVIAYVASL